MEEYNEIPVHYCKNCLSLAIKRFDTKSRVSYCNTCGCTETGKTHIKVWEEYYEEKYSKPYIQVFKWEDYGKEL